jgi:hypothetical protein
MSELQTNDRAIDAGLLRVSDLCATSGPMEERSLEGAAPGLNRAPVLRKAG